MAVVANRERDLEIVEPCTGASADVDVLLVHEDVAADLKVGHVRHIAVDVICTGAATGDHLQLVAGVAQRVADCDRALPADQRFFLARFVSGDVLT
jgi:hypothetical protein